VHAVKYNRLAGSGKESRYIGMLNSGLMQFRQPCRLYPSIVGFHPYMALFRSCGVQNRPPPRNAADFFELAENCTFLDRKLTKCP
jgi:hypothetical protein